MKKLYIARQSIVDCDNNVIAYEILFRDTKDGISKMPSQIKATGSCLYTLLSDCNISKIVPEKVKVFVNIEHTILNSSFIHLLDPSKFVLEILEFTDLEQCEDKIRELHSKGFMFAIDDFNCTPEVYTKFKRILDVVSITKICLRETDLKDAVRCGECCDYLKCKHIKMLAEKVETQEEYDICTKMGFEYFQGYYIQKPEVFEITNYDDVLEELKIILED